MIKRITAGLVASLYLLIPFVAIASNDNFNDDLQNSLGEIANNLQQTTPWDASLVSGDGEGIQGLIVYVAQDLLIPIMIIIGILVAILWFYQMFFTDSDDAISKWWKTLLWWVVGIIIMFSARYLVITIVGTDGTTWFLDNGEFSGIDFIRTLYDDIIYPLLKIVLYLVIGVLFVILLTRVISFIFSPSEEVQKKSTTIIIWNSVWILIILAAKQIVEAVFGTREDILNDPLTTPSGWTGALTSWSSWFLAIVFEVINWALGLIAFIIIWIILLQGYKLLVQPDSADNIKSIGKSLGYAFLGLLVIWGWYLIVNLLLVQ